MPQVTPQAHRAERSSSRTLVLDNFSPSVSIKDDSYKISRRYRPRIAQIAQINADKKGACLHGRQHPTTRSPINNSQLNKLAPGAPGARRPAGAQRPQQPLGGPSPLPPQQRLTKKGQVQAVDEMFVRR